MSSTNTSRNFNVKKMSLVEMQLRRDKGLCFTCDDKFIPSHRCPNKQHLLLQMDDDKDLINPPQDNEIDKGLNSQDDPHLSFNDLKGSAGLGTMRFQGSTQGMRIQILIDSGNSDNFLQPRLAHYLKLPIEPIQKFKVVVGNGSALMVEGVITDLEVKVQGHSILLPVFLFPVSGANLVLGAAWLATLKAHISDYSTLTLKFLLGNKLSHYRATLTNFLVQFNFIT